MGMKWFKCTESDFLCGLDSVVPRALPSVNADTLYILQRKMDPWSGETSMNQTLHPVFASSPRNCKIARLTGSLVPSLLWLFGNVVVRMCGWQDWVTVILGDCIQVKWNCHPPSKQDVYDQCKKILSSSFTCLLDTDKQLSAHCNFLPTVSRVGTYTAAYFGIVCSECIYSLHTV